MYFTQEDFQKIERYFKERAYKDTDFSYLEPDKILDTDVVAIVHKGTNKRVTVKNLINKVSSEVNNIDDALNSHSVNAVQNKVISNALDSKVDGADYLTYWNVSKIIFDIFGF